MVDSTRNPKEQDMLDEIAPKQIGVFRIEPDASDLLPLELDPEAFQSVLPVQNYRLIFEDESIGLAVGIWDTTTMQEAFGPYPGDEYITVLDGSFAILDAEDTAVRGEVGQSATFRNGIPVSWKQEGYLRKIYLTLQADEGGTLDIASAEGGVRVLGPGQHPTGVPDADGVTRELIFRNDAGSMTVALCAFPEQRLPVSVCQTHRLIRVLQGRVTLSEPSSLPEAFGPDAHVFLPKGTACSWTVAEGTVALIVDVSAD
jgi:uncharacterized cupin superfamily protein